MLEWGLNWCITNHCHDYLIIHAAVMERNGHVLMMPAPPGAGKSTLCAALVCHGWRLLSDELAMIRMDGSGEAVPLARPVCLKNQSVAIIRDRFPLSEFGPTCANTAKGDVAHMLAPEKSVQQVMLSAPVKCIVFPRYNHRSHTQLTPRPKARTFFELAQQSFNFHILGERGFEVLRGVVDKSHCFDFTYSRLEDAFDVFDNLMSDIGDAKVTGDHVEGKVHVL